MKYYARNIYFINGTTVHRTAKAAIQAANRREGIGWICEDSDGNQWDFDPNETPRIVKYASDPRL